MLYHPPDAYGKLGGEMYSDYSRLFAGGGPGDYSKLLGKLYKCLAIRKKVLFRGKLNKQIEKYVFKYTFLYLKTLNINFTVIQVQLGETTTTPNYWRAPGLPTTILTAIIANCWRRAAGIIPSCKAVT